MKFKKIIVHFTLKTKHSYIYMHCISSKNVKIIITLYDFEHQGNLYDCFLLKKKANKKKQTYSNSTSNYKICTNIYDQANKCLLSYVCTFITKSIYWIHWIIQYILWAMPPARSNIACIKETSTIASCSNKFCIKKSAVPWPAFGELA